MTHCALEYQHVDIQRLSPDPTTYATPAGAQIGQGYSVFSMRSMASRTSPAGLRTVEARVSVSSIEM